LIPLPTDSKVRKEIPVTTGVFDYFPNALAEVAKISYYGNQKHNPGQPLHWSRGKSNDHPDCIGRHLLERGSFDENGLRHSAMLAWRALANLQIELEEEAKTVNPTQLPPEGYRFVGSSPAEIVPIDMTNIVMLQVLDEPEIPTTLPVLEVTVDTVRAADFEELTCMGCTDKVAKQVTGGITYRKDILSNPDAEDKYSYVAGPMRGYENFNFPAFDATRDVLIQNGWNVISPADIDRNAGDTNEQTGEVAKMTDYVIRDFFVLFFLAHLEGGSISMLPGWEKSTGAVAEFFMARWLGLKVFDQFGVRLTADKVNYIDLNASIEKFLNAQQEN
jgi:hypothetical protein